MNVLAVPLACALVAGCASSPGMAELGRVVQTTVPAGTIPATGGGTGTGSVASGGTGYLPCAGPAGSAARLGCR